LFYGGRVSKDDLGPEAYGAVDEAVAALGLARSQADAALSERLIALQRDLFVVAAEMATAAENRRKLVPGRSLVTSSMVDRLEGWIDELEAEVGLPDTFVVPGQAAVPAALDLARTVIRRAERRAVALVRDTGIHDTEVVRYLNRLADYVYMLARANEQEWEPSRPNKESR
jgi:cob(I)alamin adenosyltransferase